jgi:vitamin B12/bleomycin/antimicrobial peptide transport system ATP-binding/permease protein
LDEATSALDAENERNLYQQLKNSGITFLSVGHRESLNEHHQFTLDFTGDQTWVFQGSNTESNCAFNNQPSP